MGQPACRSCRGRTGHLVLDLGEQPACDYFPSAGDPGPDPVYPLQMWLCGGCGLAQLGSDPTTPEEPRGAEPTALVAQAADAIERVARAGMLPGPGRAAEYGSPHGGSWLRMLAGRGLATAAPGEPADIVVDCFGLMHSADQSEALATRMARVAPGGTLLLQYHSLDAIIAHGQWNALRHGHFAYYSTTALVAMLAAQGFSARKAWSFDLYGGTVLLAAGRDTIRSAEPDATVSSLLARDTTVGVRDPLVVSGLQAVAGRHSAALRSWLVAERASGRSVLGYGAASRAVALLRSAQVDRTILPAVVDASPAKRGLRMPGTDIPVVGPDQLVVRRPDSVLLFVADLRAEVGTANPEIEAAGGRWVDVDGLAP